MSPIQAPTNADIAAVLDEIADLLEQRNDNPYRVQAFRNGAESVRASQEYLTQLVRQEGGQALKRIEGIGQGLGATIFEFIQTGRSEYLRQLRARQSPEKLFQSVPGIGPKLARRITRQLDVTSLEALELAAYDGRLALVKGFGPRRVAAVRYGLADMLGRSTGPPGDATLPPVSLLLEVDADYRRRAAAGALPRLAPRSFNPDNEAWLPVMQVEQAGWTMTVLFSNSARAHELDRTHDWVVIYYEKDGPEAQATVVTETNGPLAGKRVIRGRERECRQFYRGQSEAAA